MSNPNPIQYDKLDDAFSLLYANSLHDIYVHLDRNFSLKLGQTCPKSGKFFWQQDVGRDSDASGLTPDQEMPLAGRAAKMFSFLARVNTVTTTDHQLSS